jgi:DNA-binding NtrC family response regulator
LRERPEDVLALARFFLAQQGPSLYLSAGAEERILAYPWTGNVRELRNAIVSAAVMMSGNQLQASDLVMEEQLDAGGGAVAEARREERPSLAALASAVAPASAPPSPPHHHPATSGSGASVNLEELERQAIMRALDQTGQHQERAAHLLGISSRTLSRKLKSYGLGRSLAAAAQGSRLPAALASTGGRP